MLIKREGKLYQVYSGRNLVKSFTDIDEACLFVNNEGAKYDSIEHKTNKQNRSNLRNLFPGDTRSTASEAEPFMLDDKLCESWRAKGAGSAVPHRAESSVRDRPCGEFVQHEVSVEHWSQRTNAGIRSKFGPR